MTDIAGAQDLPDTDSLQPPPDLPDVGNLTEAQTLPPMRGIAGMPSYSPAVVARLRNGDPVSRVIGKLADGFATGYGNAFSDITAEDQATMAKAGYKPVTPEEMGTIGGTLRFFGHALMDDVSRVKAGVLSIFPAAVEAARQGVTQGAKEVGLEAGPGGTAEQAGEGAAGFAEFMGTDAGIQTMLMSRAQYAEATRIMPNPAGGHFDQRIGPVPDHVEAAQQAAQVAEHYGLDIVPAITEAYGKGVLPAEIHVDAKTNATILPDLAEGKVPDAYPVSDWTGREAAPAAATSPEIPDLTKIPGTIEQAEKLPMAGSNLGGLDVTGNIPNTSSISASLGEDYTEVGGIRAIPMSDFPGAGKGYVSAADTERVTELANQIKANGYIDPLIVVMDKDGPYVLEGGHRLDALKQLGHENVPAMVVVDHGNEHPAATAAYDAIEQQRAADQAAFLKERGMTQAQASALPAAEKKEINTAFQKWRVDKAVPKPAAKPPVVPTRLRPIEGTGELTPMQLSQSVEEAVGKEFEGVPASRVASNEVQESAARKFVELDPERADQVAMFGATPPKNLLGQMVYNEVVRRAAATGDFDKLRMLATQSTQPGILRRSGQEIQAASQLGDGNAAADMTRVHEARQAALKAQGVDVAANENAAAAEYAPIRAATRAAKGPDAWAKFLSAIQCPE